jgi:hypothetical protein
MKKRRNVKTSSNASRRAWRTRKRMQEARGPTGKSGPVCDFDRSAPPVSISGKDAIELGVDVGDLTRSSVSDHYRRVLPNPWLKL